ncbi:MAG: cupin domain-containing protein [Pseudomonadota bacterium]
MQVTRFQDAQPYEAPNHYDMRGLRLQGWNVSDCKNFWVGLSQFLPGGGAEMESSPLEKVYIVQSGEVTIILANGDETVLGPRDSCYLAPGEAREIVNRGNETVYMLVVMNYPEGYSRG